MTLKFSQLEIRILSSGFPLDCGHGNDACLNRFCRNNDHNYLNLCPDPTDDLVSSMVCIAYISSSGSSHQFRSRRCVASLPRIREKDGQLTRSDDQSKRTCIDRDPMLPVISSQSVFSQIGKRRGEQGGTHQTKKLPHTHVILSPIYYVVLP